MKTAIHWFRRDLRLTDNTAFSAALSRAGQVVPVYILSEWKGGHHWTGPNRQQFFVIRYRPFPPISSITEAG